jgi:hypothetical protein
MKNVQRKLLLWSFYEKKTFATKQEDSLYKI